MLNVVGVVILAAFYLAVLGVGIAATWWFKKKNKQEFSEEDETETSIVAGRKLGGLVGVFTMTGTDHYPKVSLFFPWFGFALLKVQSH